jgi:cholesterol transport system auxiliary component
MRSGHIFWPLALLLAGCGPLVQVGGNAPPPASLLVISATATPAADGWTGPVPVGSTIGISTPAVPAALQTLRLAVQTSSNEIAYLNGAQWAEQPARQFQRLLADTMAADGQAVVDNRTGSLPAARQISGHLRSFTLDVTGTPMVRVRYDAQLTGPTGNGLVSIRRFDASEPVASQNPAAVAAALNRAANRVAADVASWVKG